MLLVLAATSRYRVVALRLRSPSCADGARKFALEPIDDRLTTTTRDLLDGFLRLSFGLRFCGNRGGVGGRL